MEVCADKVKAPAMQKSEWPPKFGTSRLPSQIGQTQFVLNLNFGEYHA